MAMPGVTDEGEIKLLLRKLLKEPDEVMKFAVIARGPKEGELILSRKEKLKRKDIQGEAEAAARKTNGGKAVKLDVIAGECRLASDGKGSTMLLTIRGRAIAKAVACAEHLLARGPYKAIGFTDVIIVEADENEAESVTSEVEGETTRAADRDAISEVPPPPPPPPPPQATAKAAPPEVSDAAASFNARLATLLPRIKAAAGTAQGEQAKLRASEAGLATRKREFDQANALLDAVEALLAQAATAATPATEAAPRSGAFVDYAKARLAWVATRKKVAGDIQKLEQAILEAYKGSPELREAQAATRQLDRILTVLDETLAEKLDEGLNASDPETRARVNGQAAAIIERYTRFLYTDPLMVELDDNPFVPLGIQEEVAATLDALAEQLA